MKWIFHTWPFPSSIPEHTCAQTAAKASFHLLIVGFFDLLISEQEYSERCRTVSAGEIRPSFMNKDASASSALWVQYVLVTALVIYSPTRPGVVEVDLMGDRDAEPPLPVVGKIYHLTPLRTSRRKWTHKSRGELSAGLCLLISRGALLFLHTPLLLFTAWLMQSRNFCDQTPRPRLSDASAASCPTAELHRLIVMPLLRAARLQVSSGRLGLCWQSQVLSGDIKISIYQDSTGAIRGNDPHSPPLPAMGLWWRVQQAETCPSWCFLHSVCNVEKWECCGCIVLNENHTLISRLKETSRELF